MHTKREYRRKVDSPPWKRRGECAHSLKYREASLAGRRRGGSFKPPIIGKLNEPLLDGCALSGLRTSSARLRPAKEASQHFPNGRSHPSFSKEGNQSTFSMIRTFRMRHHVANEVRNFSNSTAAIHSAKSPPMPASLQTSCRHNSRKAMECLSSATGPAPH